MRVFVAGGSGVVGRSLIPQLIEAGHQVTATTRQPHKVGLLRSLGATPVVLDALDGQAVMSAVQRARPEVIVNQLSRLPARYEINKLEPWLAATGRLRVEGTRHLLAAARSVGAKRLISQSIAFMYATEGPPVVSEDAPFADAPPPFRAGCRATLEGERLTLEADGIEGVVLRYGRLYGPGTYFSRRGDFARQACWRRLPVLGRGLGLISFLHVEDAASAVVRAVCAGRGVYNVVDDDPALARDWIPAFADLVGAPRPERMPCWVAALMVGWRAVALFTRSRGASSQRAHRELGWRPRYPSWRQGFARHS